MAGRQADEAAKAGAIGAPMLAVIALVAGVIALFGAFSLPPLDRDESRFAQATAQMLETGDYVNIRFQESERNKKPVGIYWMQAASVSAFSSVEAREIWAYRIPSIIGAVLAAVFTAIAGARLYSPAVGFLAGLLIASSPGLAAEATIAKTDAALLASICAAQAAFIHVFAAWERGGRAGWGWPLTFWIALGAGILLKGPITPMIVGFTGAAMLVRTRTLGWVAALRPVTGVAVLALMVAPWAVAIGIATEGRFYTEALGGDMLGKVGTAQEHHSGPPGYHLALVWLLLWPATALIVPGFARALATRGAWTSWFLLGWIVPAWLVFELTATKLPHYTLPLYPALAILAARVALGGAALRRKWARRIGAGAYTAIGLGVAVAIAALPHVLSTEAARAPCYAAAAVVGAGALVVGGLFITGRARPGVFGAIALSAFVAWSLLDVVLPSLDRLQISPRLSDAIREAGLHPLRDGAPPVALAGFAEPSAVFLIGTQTALTDGAGAAAHLAQFPGAAVAVDRSLEADFRAALAGLDISVRALAVVEGLNYSKGREISLTVYAAEARS